jgi:hypothetical protein
LFNIIKHRIALIGEWWLVAVCELWGALCLYMIVCCAHAAFTCHLSSAIWHLPAAACCLLPAAAACTSKIYMYMVYGIACLVYGMWAAACYLQLACSIYCKTWTCDMWTLCITLWIVKLRHILATCFMLHVVNLWVGTGAYGICAYACMHACGHVCNYI